MRPTRGRGLVAGHDVAREPEQVRLRIGVALQDAALDDRQTGRELLDLQGRLYGLRRAERSVRVEQVLAPRRHRHRHRPPDQDLLGRHEAPPRPRRGADPRPRHPLPRRADHRARPREPGRGVGARSGASTSEHGTTIFLTTQYLEEADELADRVGIISRGRLVAEGTPDELKRTVGTDVIVARVESLTDDHAARRCDRSPGSTRSSAVAPRGHGARRQRCGRHEPGRPGPARRGRDRGRASRCAPPPSTTCSSSSPASHLQGETPPDSSHHDRRTDARRSETPARRPPNGERRT